MPSVRPKTKVKIKLDELIAALATSIAATALAPRPSRRGFSNAVGIRAQSREVNVSRDSLLCPSGQG